MTEDEIIVADTWTESPELEPVPEPEPAPVPDPEPTPMPAAPSMEVVTVEDLLERLTGGQDEGKEEEPAEEKEADELPGFSLNPAVVYSDTVLVKVIDMDKSLDCLNTIQGRLNTIQEVTDHPALTTPFEDYTVTEGLLLLLFLSVFVTACVKLLKGGFAWLR